MFDIVFSVDESYYLQWQSELLKYSYDQVGQLGNLVRLVASKDKIPEISGISDFYTTDYKIHPYTGEYYPPYNKPASIKEWCNSSSGNSKVMIIDPDCVFVHQWNPQKNKNIAEKMFFMGPETPISQEVIKRHCRRNQDLVQPVGVPIFIDKQILTEIAPRWLDLTEEMRSDRKTLKAIPWIIEMYAYAIASAETGTTYTLENNQQFPTEDINDRPIVHYSYATENKRKTWKWDKRCYDPRKEKEVKVPSDIPKGGSIFHKVLESWIKTLG
jgi:hypothetical protein